jgi:hypothetical protein
VEAGVVGKPSFTTFQSVVALVAGLSSIVGAAYSAMGTLRPSAPPPGEIVAVVREAATGQLVRTAVLEVLTPQDALVTTMTQGDDGLARRTVSPGAYRVRALHPDFVEAVRDVQVAPSGTAEVRLALARRPRPAPAQRAPAAPRAGDAVVNGAAQAVDRGVSRLLGRLGF